MHSYWMGSHAQRCHGSGNQLWGWGRAPAGMPCWGHFLGACGGHGVDHGSDPARLSYIGSLDKMELPQKGGSKYTT